MAEGTLSFVSAMLAHQRGQRRGAESLLWREVMIEYLDGKGRVGFIGDPFTAGGKARLGRIYRGYGAVQHVRVGHYAFIVYAGAECLVARVWRDELLHGREYASYPKYRESRLQQISLVLQNLHVRHPYYSEVVLQCERERAYHG